MGVLNGDNPEPRRRPSRQTQNGHAGTNLRRRQRATPEASPISHLRERPKARTDSEQPRSLQSAESQRVRLDRSGWGPGGRRFKSCLPDGGENPGNLPVSGAGADLRVLGATAGTSGRETRNNSAHSDGLESRRGLRRTSLRVVVPAAAGSSPVAHPSGSPCKRRISRCGARVRGPRGPTRGQFLVSIGASPAGLPSWACHGQARQRCGNRLHQARELLRPVGDAEGRRTNRKLGRVRQTGTRHGLTAPRPRSSSASSADGQVTARTDDRDRRPGSARAAQGEGQLEVARRDRRIALASISSRSSTTSRWIASATPTSRGCSCG